MSIRDSGKKVDTDIVGINLGGMYLPSGYD
jgi:hypothetical protein